MKTLLLDEDLPAGLFRALTAAGVSCVQLRNLQASAADRDVPRWLAALDAILLTLARGRGADNLPGRASGAGLRVVTLSAPRGWGAVEGLLYLVLRYPRHWERLLGEGAGPCAAALAGRRRAGLPASHR